MAMRSSVILTAALFTLSCGKANDSKPSTGSGSAGSAATTMAGSGSATGSSATTMAGSGSAEPVAVGSGSAMAGSAMGGSAMAGSGSAVAMAGSDVGSDFDFDKLEHHAQGEFMKAHVVGSMKTAFQAFDGKKFAEFNCKTCHGKNADKNHFKMPTPDLPVLDFAKIQAGKQNPKMTEFMEKTVKPEMAKILHQAEFDPMTKQGKFGCLACHTAKKG